VIKAKHNPESYWKNGTIPRHAEIKQQIKFISKREKNYFRSPKF